MSINSAIAKVILGSGQFIGVNHYSHRKGIERANHFLKMQNVLSIIEAAKGCGFGGMMISTHPTSIKILNELSKDKKLKDNFQIYPNLPYMQKYVIGANEKGMVGFVLDMLKSNSISNLAKGARAVLANDLYKILKSLIDIELSFFSKLEMGPVFLHNILTDLALSLRIEEIFHFYIEYIQKKYGLNGAFVTLNFPELSKYFKEIGLDQPIIQAPFNKIGFQMNPSIDSNIAAIESFQGIFVAMTTLAAGFLGPHEAYSYLSSINNINSITVGASTNEHLKQTYNHIIEIRKY